MIFFFFEKYIKAKYNFYPAPQAVTAHGTASDVKRIWQFQSLYYITNRLRIYRFCLAELVTYITRWLEEYGKIL